MAYKTNAEGFLFKKRLKHIYTLWHTFFFSLVSMTVRRQRLSLTNLSWIRQTHVDVDRRTNLQKYARARGPSAIDHPVNLSQNVNTLNISGEDQYVIVAERLITIGQVRGTISSK